MKADRFRDLINKCEDHLIREYTYRVETGQTDSGAVGVCDVLQNFFSKDDAYFLFVSMFCPIKNHDKKRYVYWLGSTKTMQGLNTRLEYLRMFEAMAISTRAYKEF